MRIGFARKRSAALLPLAALLAVTACGGGEEEEESRAPAATPVRVEPVSRRTFTDYFNLIGTTRGGREATLVFEVGGVVERILAPQGSTVSAGDSIAALNDDLLRAALDEARAARSIAVDLYERSAGLEARGGISEFDLSNLDKDREMAEARYASVEAQHDRTILRAPFAGIVDMRFLDVGDYAAPGVPFARLLDLSVAKAEVPLPEVDVGMVHAGDRAEVRADPFPGRVFEGEVTFISREVDRDARTVNVEVRIPNGDGALGVGMTVRVRLVKEAHENVVVVPQDVVVESERGTAVFLVRRGVAARTPVHVSTIYGEMAVVDSGLAEGESLIVVGGRDLVDGEPVEIVR